MSVFYEKEKEKVIPPSLHKNHILNPLKKIFTYFITRQWC